MGVLVGIALVAGMVTAISPCVLPVLPIVFAGSASGGRRRPYAIAAGLVLGFTAFTLAATALLDALGLPEDLLRDAAIGVVVAMGVSLLLPRLGDLLERPFRRLGRRAPGDVGGGVVLGVSLGLLFTPCAGPIIGTVAFVAATRRFSAEAVVVTLAYALGAGVVLLALALAARRGLDLRPLRARAPLLRRSLGAVIAAVGILMALGLDTRLQTKVPGYLDALRGLEEAPRRRRGSPGSPGRELRRRSRAPSRTSASRRASRVSVSGSTRSPCGWATCRARSSSSTSGPTPASTACGRCRTSSGGTRPTPATGS